MILKSILSGKTFDFADHTSPHTNLTPHQLAYDAMWELASTGRWLEFKKAMCGCRSRGTYNCRCSDRDNVIAV
jgi:hypothetical protein